MAGAVRRAARRAPAAAARLQPGRAALGVPLLRPPDHRAREHPGRLVAVRCAASARRAGADLRALPDRRAHRRRRPGLARSALRADVAALAACGLLWTLIALTFIDLDTQLLPDDITLPLLWAGLIVNLFGTFVRSASAVIGAVAGYLVLWIVYWAFKLIRGKEGMGYGDFKLLAALGAWLGWKVLPDRAPGLVLRRRGRSASR